LEEEQHGRMAAVMKASGAGYRFDDRHVNWQKRSDLENFLVSIPDIGEKCKVVDFIVKFEPIKPSSCIATSPTPDNTSCMKPTVACKEIRPVVSYTNSPPGEPHRECGGRKVRWSFTACAVTGLTLTSLMMPPMSLPPWA
jgi:hypothetical protein